MRFGVDILSLLVRLTQIFMRELQQTKRIKSTRCVEELDFPPFLVVLKKSRMDWCPKVQSPYPGYQYSLISNQLVITDHVFDEAKRENLGRFIYLFIYF